MTVIHTGLEWGVRHHASPDRHTHIDPRANAADAYDWQSALRFAGNSDAQLVVRGPHTAWSAVPDLPAREAVALTGVALGLTQDALSRRLEISPRTLRRTLVSAVTRLGAASQCHAVALAVLYGHVDLAAVHEGTLPPWPDPVPLKHGPSPRARVKAVMVDA